MTYTSYIPFLGLPVPVVYLLLPNIRQVNLYHIPDVRPLGVLLFLVSFSLLVSAYRMLNCLHISRMFFFVFYPFPHLRTHRTDNSYFHAIACFSWQLVFFGVGLGWAHRQTPISSDHDDAPAGNWTLPLSNIWFNNIWGRLSAWTFIKTGASLIELPLIRCKILFILFKTSDVGKIQVLNRP